MRSILYAECHLNLAIALLASRRKQGCKNIPKRHCEGIIDCLKKLDNIGMGEFILLLIDLEDESTSPDKHRLLTKTLERHKCKEIYRSQAGVRKVLCENKGKASIIMFEGGPEKTLERADPQLAKALRDPDFAKRLKRGEIAEKANRGKCGRDYICRALSRLVEELPDPAF